MQKCQSVNLVLLIFVFLLVGCKEDTVDLSQVDYKFTISYDHSAEGGQGKNLTDFIESTIKKTKYFNSFKIELHKENSTISFNKVNNSDNNFSISIEEQGEKYDFALNNLSFDTMQEIINLRFSGLPELIDKYGK